MAEAKPAPAPAPEEKKEAAPPKPKKPKGPLLLGLGLIVLMLVLVAVAALGAFWMWTQLATPKYAPIPPALPSAAASPSAPAEGEHAKVDEKKDSKADEGKGEGEKKKKKKGSGEKPAFAVLSTFTINLSGGDTLQTKVTLQLGNEKEGEEIKGYLPALSDTANQILSGQSKAALNAPGGRDKLHDDLLKALNERLDKLGSTMTLDDVLFESFVTQ